MDDIDYTQPLVGDVRTVSSPDGAQLHTVSLGSGGRTVLLAHGYGSNAASWNLVAPAMAARGFRVIAFDQRGHGRSTIGSSGVGTEPMASDYGSILEAYDAGDAIVVGHSMGGFLAIAFLVESTAGAERVGAFLAMATFAGDVNRDNLQNRMQIPLIQTGVLLQLLRVGAIGRAFTRTLVGDDFRPAMATAFVDAFLGQPHRPLVPILRAFVHEDRYGELGQLDLPCSIVVGSEDATTPPFHTADLHAGIGGSRLVTLDGKGHLLNWEAPEAIVDEVVQLAAAG